MATKVTPLADRILVRPIDPSLKTEAGLILLSPQEDDDAPKQGEVVAVGMVSAISPLKVGDKILYSAHAGIPIMVNNENLVMMKNLDALATYETV